MKAKCEVRKAEGGRRKAEGGRRKDVEKFVVKSDSKAMRQSGFTLIEVMLAIAILAVICGTIYQFTSTMVRVSNVSVQTDDREQSFAGLRRLLTAELAHLPLSESGAFDGQKDLTHTDRRDQLTMICPGGNPLLTPDAHGLYLASLTLAEIPKASGHLSLVLAREPYRDPSQENRRSSQFRLATTSTLPSDVLPLLAGVKSLEFSYYDPRLNNWLDTWADSTMLPGLVRVKLTMENSARAYEFTERVPGGGMRRGLPASLSLPQGLIPPNQGPPNGGGAPPNFTPPPPPPNLQIPGPPPNFPGGQPPTNPRIGAPR